MRPCRTWIRGGGRFTPAQPAPQHVDFAIEAPANALQLRLDLKVTSAVTDVEVDERPVKILGKPGQWSHLVLAAPHGGVLVSFRPSAHGKLEARWALVTPGWPADATSLPKRSANLMPWSLSDTTVTLWSVPGPGRPALDY